ncbi:hypothetical protein MTR67_034885 [Solanum verrucosum]|uniref:Uncharacterized protein n=1 Tax=Solanum verrucosum TaxID=315347 RepID=A0AAF0U8W3_SOLVR|nr:hypothetical protein MTR67_034885 [Solanum verrucosum]
MVFECHSRPGCRLGS